MEFLPGKARRYAIGLRIDVMRDQYVHHNASRRCQPRSNGVAGPLVEFGRERESRAANIDGDRIVCAAAVADVASEVRRDTGDVARQAEESARDGERKGIDID